MMNHTTLRFARWLIAALSLSGVTLTAMAADKVSLDEVTYSKLPGDRVQVTFKMSGAPPEPALFTIADPARISIDFPDTKVGLSKNSLKVNEGALTSLNAIEAGNRTRVVLNLVRPVTYQTSVEGDRYVITLNSSASAAQSAAQQKTTRFSAKPKAGKYAIKSVDFRRGPAGDGKVIIGLSDSGMGIDIREQAGEVVVDFLDATIPAELQRRLDVVDFATPVQTIDTFPQGRHTRLVVTAGGKYEHLAYQAGDVFTINIKPIVEKPEDKAKKRKDEFGYTGEKLSLNFQNIETRAALQVIADFTGLNFVTSDSVKGSITLRLKDVPWDQALDIILDARGLAMKRNGNVVTVGPHDEMAAKEKAILEANKQVEQLEPLVSELIQINYAKAEDIAKLLKSIKAVELGQSSMFGSVSVQKVETRLVEANDDFAKNLGTKLGTNRIHTRGDHSSLTCGTLECNVDIGNGDPIQIGGNGLSVNLGADGVNGATVGSLAVSILKTNNGNMLNLEISALEGSGKGKVISSPRLITANQKKARIEQGQERVFTTTVLGVGSVVTKKAVLALEVTPQITPDERVILDVLVTQDNFADAATGVINTRQITTQVLLDNGETVVIGGIYRENKTKTITKVPFLGDLPLLGWAFRKKNDLDTKSELLIFLTPRIMAESLSLSGAK